MTQIAPATLIAIQSLAAPAKARPATPGTFEPLSPGDLAPRRDGPQAGPQVSLSGDALAFLNGKDLQAGDLPPQRSPVAPKATADTYRSEPPGSRLDISV